MLEKREKNAVVQIFGFGVRAIIAAVINPDDESLGIAGRLGRAQDHLANLQESIDYFMVTTDWS